MESKGCSRREFVKRAGGAFVLAATQSGWLARQALARPVTSKTHEVTIGTFGPSHCATPFVFSSLRGFFKDAGINVRLINYDDMGRIASDLATGSLDFGQLVLPLAQAVHTGTAPFSADVPMAVCQIGGTNGAALMVRKGMNIQNPEDFRVAMGRRHRMGRGASECVESFDQEKPLRILLAEDNAVNQEVAEELLKAMRHKVYAVTNGRLAVQAVRESFFDLILMDIQMPEMGGFEATREIRVLEEKTGRRTPIIAMTAHALKEDQQRCLDEGMDGSKGADNNNLNAVAMYECM